jgi:hypothetical protein
MSRAKEVHVLLLEGRIEAHCLFDERDRLRRLSRVGVNNAFERRARERSWG